MTMLCGVLDPRLRCVPEQQSAKKARTKHERKHTCGTFISQEGLGTLSLILRTKNRRETNRQEGNHASDKHNNDTQRHLLSPGLLDGLFVDATHAHERWQGPAGRDTRADHPARGRFVLFTLLEHRLGGYESVRAREGLATGQCCAATDTSGASGPVPYTAWSSRHVVLCCVVVGVGIGWY